MNLTPCDLKAIHFRQHEVEHNGVKFIDFGQLQPFQAIEGQSDAMVLLLKPLLQELRHAFLVFNNEHAHGQE